MASVTSVHLHLFVCKRSPLAHNFQMACKEVLVVCPDCGSAGNMFVLVPQT